jgi:hypothetical protein
MDWNHLAQDMDQCSAKGKKIVNTVIILMNGKLMATTKYDGDEYFES